jgi:hypothetical protein
MIITDTQKEIVHAAETDLAAAGTEDIARLWIQRGVGLIVSTCCAEHRREQLEDALAFIQHQLDKARPH